MHQEEGREEVEVDVDVDVEEVFTVIEVRFQDTTHEVLLKTPKRKNERTRHFPRKRMSERAKTLFDSILSLVNARRNGSASFGNFRRYSRQKAFSNVHFWPCAKYHADKRQVVETCK